jgi:hypothetical protein
MKVLLKELGLLFSGVHFGQASAGLDVGLSTNLIRE